MDPQVNAEKRTVQCSAKGCREEAVWGLRWNNPSIHTPQRNKVWLACETHESTLRSFLDVRGFYRESVPVGELTASDG